MDFGFVIIPIAIVLIFVLCFPLFLNIGKKQASTLSGIRNYDDFMLEFCYKVPHSKDKILSILNVPNIYDELKYCFDPIGLIITFDSIEYGASAKYQLIIQDNDSGSLLRVKAVGTFVLQNRYAALQNSFWANKIQAEPVRYFKPST